MASREMLIAKLKAAAYAIAAEYGYNDAYEALEDMIRQLKDEQWK